MAILNYTTKIDADKTAMEIARCLSMHGAQAVLTEYDEKNGSVTAISFKIILNDKPMSFRLPCDWQPVLRILESDSKVPRANKTKEQAVRTAWRIVKDWVEAQMALVETRMVNTAEVFLPYMVMRDGRTLAQNVQSNPAFLLGSGNENK